LFELLTQNGKNVWDNIFDSPDKTIIFLNTIENNSDSYLNKTIAIAAHYYVKTRQTSCYHKMILSLDNKIKTASIGKMLLQLSGVENYQVTEMTGSYGAALTMLGFCYIYEIGVLKNETQGLKLWNESNDLGYAPSQYELGKFYIKFGNVTKGINLIKEAYEGGCLDAQVLLGEFYLNGIHGCPLDLEEALRLFTMKNVQAHPEAKRNLAHCFIAGLGVSIDSKRGIQLLTEASELSIEAQRLLAQLYFKGKGVAVNLMEGARLCHLAADKGDAKSQSMLGQCYNKGIGVPPNRDKAIEYWNKASKQGDVNAKKNLIEIESVTSGSNVEFHNLTTTKLHM